MSVKFHLAALGLLLNSFHLAADAPAVPVRVLDQHRMYHLGTQGFPEWEEFAGKKPHGRRVDIRFRAVKNRTPQILRLRQRQVKTRWPVLLNNKRIGWLLSIDPALWHSVTIPAGALKDGDNTLSVVSPKQTDDIEVGDFQLVQDTDLSRLLGQQLDITVTSDAAEKPIPCRITIVDKAGTLAAIVPKGEKQPLALRPGVIYTGNGRALLGLHPGKYTVYASRGFEYSVAKAEVDLTQPVDKSLRLSIRREVPTPGLVSIDTHIHTLTRSGHGDSSEVERMFTIAGEGIELAVATDHNHHADYRPVQKATGTTPFFTSVIGNEVTTKTGHFNAFPIAPNSPVPDYKLGDWTKLMASMRGTPGVRSIVLNHPRNVHSGFSPMAPEHYNSATGRNLFGAPYSFDAMEVVTSAAMQSDIMALYRDWFAMLNWGHHITAVGSSDTHDVSRFILGQARTYLECPDGDPAKIDVAKACDSLNKMRALVSMGLLVKLKVDGKFRAGDIATGLEGKIRVHTRVLGPSWVTATRLRLFANGVMIRERKIGGHVPDKNPVVKDDHTWILSRPRHDVHLVAIATGPGITAPFWESPRPYQPTSRKHQPQVQGSTNPVFIDGDRDGRYTPPRLQAGDLLKKHNRDVDAMITALRSRDEAVATQLAGLLHDAGHDVRKLQSRVARIPAARAGFAAFVATLPPKAP